MSGNNRNGEFKLIVMSSPDGFEHEIKAVHKMFEAGLQYFHLRKPKFSTQKLRKYLNRIQKKYRNRIIIHSHHELSVPYKLRGMHLTKKHRTQKKWRTWFLTNYVKFRHPVAEITVSYHSIGELKDEKNPGYSYVFLSPVFDSISKVGYRSTFNDDSLKKILEKTSFTVIAMGGIDEDKILKAKDFGFQGVALLGSLWKAENPVEKFKRIQALCQQDENT